MSDIQLTPNTSWIMIPPHVACLDIPNGAKLVFGRIFALCNEEGICQTYNRELGEGIGLTQATVSEYVRLLVKKNVLGMKLYRDKDGKVIDRRLWITLQPQLMPLDIERPPQSGLDTSPIIIGDLPNQDLSTKYIDTNILSTKKLNVLEDKSIDDKKLVDSPIDLRKPKSIKLNKEPVVREKYTNTSRNSIMPLTELEMWEMAKSLDVPLLYVKRVSKQFWTYIEEPKNRKKYKTSYKTIKRWIEMGLSKGQIEHCNETEKLQLESDHPDKVKEKEDVFAWAKEKGIIE